MNSLNSSVANNTCNLNSSQRQNECTSLWGASAVAATILLSTIGMQNSININQNSFTNCIEYSNMGTIDFNCYQKLGERVRAMEMVVEKNLNTPVPAVSKTIKFKIALDARQHMLAKATKHEVKWEQYAEAESKRIMSHYYGGDA